jgi:hypothetical protein
LPRILAVTAKLTVKTPEEIAIASGTNFFVDNTEYKKNNNLPRETASLFNLLLSAMKRLTEYVEIYAVDKSSEIEKHLWAFKLSQEIIPSVKEISDSDDSTQNASPDANMNELHLQKILSKFLIERGVLTFGRQFARSEIDLYIPDFGDPYFIEVKIYKTKPSERKIKDGASQTFSYGTQLKHYGHDLLSHMDETKQARGILIIFNYSDHSIEAPKKWLRGRIWILPINLAVTPSKTKGAIIINESIDQEKIFDVLTI